MKKRLKKKLLKQGECPNGQHNTFNEISSDGYYVMIHCMDCKISWDVKTITKIKCK
jgi:hypothetical protein